MNFLDRDKFKLTLRLRTAWRRHDPVDVGLYLNLARPNLRQMYCEHGLCYARIPRMNAKPKPQPAPANSVSPPIAIVDDESALVAAARAGDVSAFETLVNRYERKIFRLTQHITQNTEDAEDASQEAFLKAYEHLGEFQGNSRFYTWLVRIAVNQALMKLRKRRNRDVSLDEEIETEENFMPRDVEDWGPSPEERYSQDEMARILSQVIGELDPSFRTVFQLRDIDELSTEETADALGISIPAVKSRLLRARLKLRDKLNRYFLRGVAQ